MQLMRSIYGLKDKQQKQKQTHCDFDQSPCVNSILKNNFDVDFFFNELEF